VTGVFASSAEREAAFRLLENHDVAPSAVCDAVFDATARRTSGNLLVAVDTSSLTFGDHARRRELGRVGNSIRQTRGLQVLSALCMDAEGVPLGLLDQRWWARETPPDPRRNQPKCHGRRYEQTETKHWVDALVACDERIKTQAPESRAWYQLDRGADCWPVLKTAIDRSLLLTVRSYHDRRLLRADGSAAYLNDTMLRQPVLGHFEVAVAARPGRPARTARLSIRATSVVVHARVTKKRREALRVNAVLAEEKCRRRGDRIRWLLLTTHSASDFTEAREVVAAYASRWRVEEFHRAWKSGVCNVEASQLHSRTAIIKWATILAAVAARALRLAYLARTTPDMPAAEEFTEDEIDAAYILAKRPRDRRKRVTLAEMIEIVADLGGYAHKYSAKRRPGPLVLGRGLADVETLAKGLRNMREMR
jgi:hypothetical protein